MPEIAQFKVVLPNHRYLKPDQAFDARPGFLDVNVGIEIVFPSATVVNQLAPQFSCLPPAVDGFGVAKADED